MEDHDSSVENKEYDILGLNYNPEYKPDATTTLSYYDTLKHLQDHGMSSKVIFAPHELKTMASNGFNKNRIAQQKASKEKAVDPSTVTYHKFLGTQTSASVSHTGTPHTGAKTKEILPKPETYTHLLLKTTNISPADLKQFDTHDLTEYSNNNDLNNSNIDKKYEKQEAYEVYMKYEGRAL